MRHSETSRREVLKTCLVGLAGLLWPFGEVTAAEQPNGEWGWLGDEYGFFYTLWVQGAVPCRAKERIFVPGGMIPRYGITKRDVIVSVNGVVTDNVSRTPDEWSSYYFNEKRPGDALALEIERDGKKRTVRAWLA